LRNIDINLQSLEPWEDAFLDLNPKIQKLQLKMKGLKNNAEKLLESLRDDFEPLDQLLEITKNYAIPAIFPLDNISNITKIRSIGKENLQIPD